MDISLIGGVSESRALSRVDSIHTVTGTPATSNGATTIQETGTVARPGDIFKAETGPLAGQEIPVIANTANSFTIASSVAPAAGNTFYILRRTTSRTNPDGTLIASVQSGPTQFTKNGVDVTVNQDTTTPANSRGLPVVQLNTSGVQVDGPTLAGQTSGNASLTTIATNSGTQATAANQVTGNGSLATIATNSGTQATAANQVTGNGSLATIATNTTGASTAALQTSGNASLTTIATNSGTQATAANQASGNASLTTIATNSGTQATAANQTAQSTLFGAVTETAPASDTASSGLNGRLQRIAQNLTTLLGRQPATLGQKAMAASFAVTMASDQTAIPAAQATAPAKTVKSANISISATALRATTDNAAPTAGRTVLKVKPNPNNTGNIYIGAAGVTTATGMLVLPAETMEFNFDAGDYYLISDTAAQSVFILEQE